MVEYNNFPLKTYLHSLKYFNIFAKFSEYLNIFIKNVNFPSKINWNKARKSSSQFLKVSFTNLFGVWPGITAFHLVGLTVPVYDK